MEEDFFNISGITDQEEMANFDDIPLLVDDKKSENGSLQHSIGDLDDDAILAADFENMKIEEQPNYE